MARPFTQVRIPPQPGAAPRPSACFFLPPAHPWASALRPTAALCSPPPSAPPRCSPHRMLMSCAQHTAVATCVLRFGSQAGNLRTGVKLVITCCNNIWLRLRKGGLWWDDFRGSPGVPLGLRKMFLNKTGKGRRMVRLAGRGTHKLGLLPHLSNP